MRVVFLNGWGASSAMLDEFKSLLPPGYQLHVLDNLYQFELADLVSRIDDLMTSDTILMGWSLGGMLALYYASLHTKKHKPKALVILNASACFLERDDFTEGVKNADFAELKQVATNQNSKTLLRLFSHLLVEGSLTHKEDRRYLKRVFNLETLPSWPVLLKGLDYLETLDLRDELAFIHEPTLFLLGEKDVLISASPHSKALKNKSLEVDVVYGMGHFPFGTYAEDVVGVIVAYLSSLSGSESEIKC